MPIGAVNGIVTKEIHHPGHVGQIIAWTSHALASVATVNFEAPCHRWRGRTSRTDVGLHHDHITLPGSQHLIGQVDINPAYAVGRRGGCFRCNVVDWCIANCALDAQALTHPNEVGIRQTIGHQERLHRGTVVLGNRRKAVTGADHVNITSQLRIGRLLCFYGFYPCADAQVLAHPNEIGIANPVEAHQVGHAHAILAGN